jgi:hypothetical protein
MIQESEYFIMIMCLAPVVTLFAGLGLLTILKTVIGIEE